MIYLDNAATGGFKPNSVLRTVETVIKYLTANPGRSGHRLSLKGAELVFDCRKTLASAFSGNPERVIFTKNCTEALNLAIFGCIKKGGNVVTTVYEHNSVLRPLYHLQQSGLITLTVVSPDQDGQILPAIENAINKDTYMVVTTSVSNVTGQELPVFEIGKLCKKYGIIYLLDGAQGAGHIHLDLKEQNITMLALAGHKGLCGIMGSGVLLLDDKISLSPLLYGGTGTESLSTLQPLTMPEGLEAGTLNLPAIAGLKEGVQFIKENRVNFSINLYQNTEKVIEILSKTPDVTLYSNPNHSGIIAFNVKGKDSVEVADILNAKYDIAVRGGFHCAPKAHEYLGTLNCGVVRASFAVQNSWSEIKYFIKALTEIAQG